MSLLVGIHTEEVILVLLVMLAGACISMLPRSHAHAEHGIFLLIVAVIVSVLAWCYHWDIRWVVPFVALILGAAIGQFAMHHKLIFERT